MMSNYYFSSKKCGFYPSSLKSAYEASPEGWPDDAIPVSDDDYYALFAGQKKGQIITSDSEGRPSLSAPATLTREQFILIAQEKLTTQLVLAAKAILPLQDSVDLDIATESELLLLKDWKTYRVALNRLDLSTAPDITWPEIPA